MRCRITQFARESVGLCPFRGSYVREFELSHSNPVNRIIKITHAQLPVAREKKTSGTQGTAITAIVAIIWKPGLSYASLLNKIRFNNYNT